jgi:cell division protein FtsI/penicillin-binding protein 2
MDPQTGAILAMATAPRFNATRFPTTRPDRRRNRAVTDAYEPGSTFKLVTVAAGLQEGIVNPRSSFRLPPTLEVADRTIRESHARGTQRMTVRQIVEYSSNIGTAKAMNH